MKTEAVAVLVGILFSVAGAKECYDDVDECVRKLRVLMMEERAFWFGSDFARVCTPTSGGTTCINPDPNSRSILTRLYNVTDDSELQRYAEVNNKLQLAHVQWSTPEGSYYGCGHSYEAPAIVKNLDPLSVMTINSWSLDHLPSIRWTHPAGQDENSMYTVLVWDVGYYYLHGLYINAKGEDISSATPIKAYHGPINPNPRPNVLLFAVFQQTGFVDPGTAYGVMGAILGSNVGALPVSKFLPAMGGLLTDLVAANVLSVTGDAYAMERQKNNYIINNCPFLISQSPAFKAALKGASINAAWSQEQTTLDFTTSPQLSTLTVDLAVEYFLPEDLTVDSCCVKTTFTQTLFRPDPLGTKATRPALTRTAPRISISPIYIAWNAFSNDKEQVYTLLMVDMTEAINYVNEPNLIIHWMVNNIKEGNVNTGDETLPYVGPNPFNSDEPRAYVFLLLKQASPKLDTSDIADFVSDNCPEFLRRRCGAKLSNMLQAWNLQEIVGATWFQAVQDAYARKRLYSELMVKQMVDVCYDQQGFEDPCPADQYCGSTNAAIAPAVGRPTGLAVTLMIIYTIYLNAV